MNTHQPDRIEYIPPPSEHIEAYGRQVCLGLGEDFAQAEVTAGFIQFVKIAIQIIERRLNEEKVDNEAE